MSGNRCLKPLRQTLGSTPRNSPFLTCGRTAQEKAENASALGQVVPHICGVPSDQLRVGTMNTSMGSGEPWNSGMR